MKRLARTALICALVAAPLPVAFAQNGTDATGPNGASMDHWDELEIVRRATEQFRDVEVARRAGYMRTGDCVESPEGGMGIHYTNPELAEDRKLRIRRPEVLVYEPVGERLRLVAVEYFRADADGRLDTDDDRPYLFGRGFDGPMEGHEPGMPVHYDLHAWVWKRNPAGVLAMWNPNVDCPVTPAG